MARKRARRSLPLTPANLKRVLATMEAELLGSAYRWDSNPEHLLNAFAAFRKRGVRPPEWVLRWVDHAHKGVGVKATGNVKRNTVRDMAILRAIGSELAMPKVLATEQIDFLMRRFSISRAALLTTVSRLRKELKARRPR